MEPLRPLVDNTVSQILNSRISSDPNSLTVEDRRQLLSLLTHEVVVGESKGPLMVSLPKYISSFFRMLTKESNKLDVPIY